MSPRLTDDDIDVRHIRDLRADDEELSTSRNQLKQVPNEIITILHICQLFSLNVQLIVPSKCTVFVNIVFFTSTPPIILLMAFVSAVGPTFVAQSLDDNALQCMKMTMTIRYAVKKK